jgi:hypothetical protein
MSPGPRLLPCPCNGCQTSIATIRFPGQKLQDFRPQAPVWSGTVTSANQRHRTIGALPRAPTSLCSQYPVLWFERSSIEGQFGDSELVKFIDDNSNGKTPKNRKQAPEGPTNLKKNFWGGTERERLGRLIRSPESSRFLLCLFPCRRRLSLSALTSIKLELCALPWGPPLTAYSRSSFLRRRRSSISDTVD